MRMLVDGGLERVRRDTFERREAHAHEDTIDQRTDPHLLRGERQRLQRQSTIFIHIFCTRKNTEKESVKSALTRKASVKQVLEDEVYCFAACGNEGCDTYIIESRANQLQICSLCKMERYCSS